jgi:hypothetical protein
MCGAIFFLVHKLLYLIQNRRYFTDFLAKYLHNGKNLTPRRLTLTLILFMGTPSTVATRAWISVGFWVDAKISISPFSFQGTAWGTFNEASFRPIIF